MSYYNSNINLAISVSDNTEVVMWSMVIFEGIQDISGELISFILTYNAIIGSDAMPILESDSTLEELLSGIDQIGIDSI